MVARPDLGNSLACDAMLMPVIGQVEGGKYVVQQELTFDEAYAMNKLSLKW